MELKTEVLKEKERAEEAFQEIKVLSKPGASDLFELAESYFHDANHFYTQGQLLEAFELYSYLWGLLDAGARLGLFDPGAARHHYKIDQ